MKNLNIHSNLHVNDPKNPFYDAIEFVVGSQPPFQMPKVFNSSELSDEQFEELQGWAASNCLHWATGLSMIDCANLIVEQAIENANILSKEGPKRHQRSRKKGARLPKGVICVTRPSQWGNPFETAEEFGQILELLLGMSETQVRNWIKSPNRKCSGDQKAHMVWIAQHISQLADKSIACFCPLGAKCHGDFLLKFANGV